MFVYKTNKYGRLIKYKTWLIIRENQQYEYDLFIKTTTLVTISFRTLLTLIIKFDLEILQMDTVNMFVYINLDELVYIKNPSGFPLPKTVFKLNKALYSLKR